MRGLRLAFVACVLAACGSTAPTATPIPIVPEPGTIVGCSNIDEAECEAIGDRIVAFVGLAHGRVLSVEIGLFSCPGGGRACARSLSARPGLATVDFAAGAFPMNLSIAGPPGDPRFAIAPMEWSALLRPSSPRVVGTGPFPFVLGHCGITHVIDFDGSFWVPVGQVDGDPPEAINAASGQIKLLAPNRAEYRGPSLIVTLARYPGPKFFWLCA